MPDFPADIFLTVMVGLAAVCELPVAIARLLAWVRMELGRRLDAVEPERPDWRWQCRRTAPGSDAPRSWVAP